MGDNTDLHYSMHVTIKTPTVYRKCNPNDKKLNEKRKKREEELTK